MSRSVNPVPQYFDKSGKPLIDGRMYYFESGTNTAKKTYADVNHEIENTHPVILTGDGRLPNVWFTGSAKQILADSDDEQIWERDPVTSDEASSFGDAWDSVSIYNKNDVVTLGDILYVSIIDNNQNSNPASDNTAWTQFDLVKRWNTNETYKTRDPVIGTDGQMYTSLSNINLGNDPVGDGGINWNPIGGGSAAGVFADWDASISYAIGGNSVITGSDGNYYQSIAASNLNNDPVSSPTFWTRVNFTKIWNTNETYKIDDLVTGSDSQLYQAVISNNANDPVSDDGTNWLPRHNVFDNLTLSGNTISSTDTDGDIDLAPEGAGEATYNGDKIAINDDVVTNADAITALEDAYSNGLLWDVTTTYDKPNVVVGSDDNYYTSIIDTNLANDPISDATSWSRLASSTLYNANETYDTNDACIGSDGNSYLSLGNGNIGNDPTTNNGVNWTVGVSGVITALGNLAKASDKAFWPTVNNNTVDADNDIDFNAGSIVDSGGDTVITLPSTLVKQITAAWAAGDAAGGLFSGSVTSNKTYHLFLIVKDSDGSVDAGFDITVNAANIPTGYTAYRRIGSIYTDGSSDIIGFTQAGDDFIRNDVARHYSDTTPGTSAVTITADIPTGLSLQAMVGHTIVRSGDSFVLLTALSQTNTVPTSSFATLQLGSTSTRQSVMLNIQTDSSGNYRLRSSTNTTYTINDAFTYGWIDDRTQ
jgi:hypothetical protein